MRVFRLAVIVAALAVTPCFAGGGVVSGGTSGGGGGSGDIEAVGDCATGSCFQTGTEDQFLGFGATGAATMRAVPDDSHNHTTTTVSGLDAGDVTTGTLGTARLGSGTADATTFLRGDQSWATPAGAGDITQVWTDTDGDVSALTAATGDTLDASLADSSKPFKQGTTLPVTCTEFEVFCDTDITDDQQCYICTDDAADTWSPIYTAASHLLPDVDAASDLGGPTRQFKEGFFKSGVNIDNQSPLKLYEEESNGDNFISIKAPAGVSTDRTCTLTDSATPFDSCIDTASNVTATSTIGDNAVVRGDGGARAVQASSVTIDDSGNIVTPGTITTGGTAEGELVLEEADVNGTNTITVKAPAAITSNISCTLEDDSTPFDSCVSPGGAPFADTTSIVEGSADATKEIRFEVDGLTTGTVRVLTVPDADFTLVGEGTTQTLSAKTLATPTITGAISFPDGVRQTFNPDGTNAGLNVGSQAGDPSTPSNGDLWYDSTANEMTARINGANVALGAGGSGNTSIWTAGTSASVSTTADHYQPINGTATGGAESNVYTPAAIAGTADQLRCEMNSSPGAGTSYALTLRVGGADSALTCTVADTNTGCTDLVNSVAISAGDLVNMESDPSASAPSARSFRCSMRFVAS